ncbi:Retrovirus-related Pol polyprotein from transposon TNT 1-94 [Gossypium australe]|uniref:Retrovirus-related Pol polyprotein from transposon TNT 1-94 n=1 Tax=Gossypium australe TaxID=47621 RepID=A0A5B6X1I8_9ROSI|nr:Retrovirus-related Pol polyprotein from transposon TNT 1-94 [Gossypium australe]
MSMIHKNQTWKLVDRPTHKKVFRTKLNVHGTVIRLKSRLYGADYFKTFALLARLDTNRLLLALLESFIADDNETKTSS